MAKYLLALDQSTAITGYAVFKDRGLLLVGHVSPKGSDYLDRIAKTRQWLSNIIDTLDGELEIAIEDIQLQEKDPNSGRPQRDFGVTTYKKLAHAQGALLSLVVERNIPYSIVASSSWKKTCKIRGYKRGDQKKSAQEFVKNYYKKDVTSDEADAICIGHHVLSKETGFVWS